MAYRYVKPGTEVKLWVDDRVFHGIVTAVTDQDNIEARVGDLTGYVGVRSVTHPNRFDATPPP